MEGPNKSCKDCIPMIELQRRITDVEGAIKAHETRLVMIERSVDVFNERITHIFDALNEIVVTLRKLESKLDAKEAEAISDLKKKVERPTILVWALVTTIASTIIVSVLSLILK
jgi:predicted nuclease with TOPRIM domain